MKKLPAGRVAWLHIGISAVIGLVAALIVGFTLNWRYSPLVGWDITALVFLIWLKIALHNTSPKQTADLAGSEDPGPAVSDLLLLAASLMSLIAIGILIYQVRKGDDTQKMIALSLNIVSVVLSWIIVHAVYTLKYARTYYANKTGIDFNDNAQPAYADFVYLAFTIGMTYQVSDTSLTSPEIRQVALRHALISYLFGVVIIASTINFIVSLSG